MKFWVVVTVYQGIFDDVQLFKTEVGADEFAAKVKADFNNEDIQAVKKCLEI